MQCGANIMELPRLLYLETIDDRKKWSFAMDNTLEEGSWKVRQSWWKRIWLRVFYAIIMVKLMKMYMATLFKQSRHLLYLENQPKKAIFSRTWNRKNSQTQDLLLSNLENHSGDMKWDCVTLFLGNRSAAVSQEIPLSSRIAEGFGEMFWPQEEQSCRS